MREGLPFDLGSSTTESMQFLTAHIWRFCLIAKSMDLWICLNSTFRLFSSWTFPKSSFGKVVLRFIWCLLFLLALSILEKVGSQNLPNRQFASCLPFSKCR